MQNKENLFIEKFRLLNSQDYNEDISLATSSSSDYESVTHNISTDKSKLRTKKRKRKNICSKNLPSLDIIKDVKKYSKRNDSGNKSPLLCNKNRLSPTQKRNVIQQSPILGSRNVRQRSPILSPKIFTNNSLRVKKQLFAASYKPENVNSISKIKQNEKVDSDCNIKSYQNQKDKINNSQIKYLNDEVGDCDKSSESTVEYYSRPELLNRNRAKNDLIKKVKLFFDSHFSSEEMSQNIISDSQTSSKSEELEICTYKSELNSDSSNMSSVREQTIQSLENSCLDNEEAKKVRYKKDGLAHRLSDLLKKRKANISLWHHEIYLAGNSNFVIPKQQHVVFRIQKFLFQYGCYLLEAYDISDHLYYVVINSCYINETVKTESVLKLYKPYQFVDLEDNCKLVINVCKFQIVDMNS